MKTFPMRHRRIAPVAVVLATAVVAGCTDGANDPLTGPSTHFWVDRPDAGDIRVALAAQERHSRALMETPGVVGTAVGVLPGGEVGVRVFLASADVPGVPLALDDVPVSREVTGLLMAVTDPTTRERPVHLGFSVGHPAITAGTIGARVVNGAGDVFILSNNHVLANSNDAALGDPILQPGPFDGGTAADQIATLAGFKPIDFSGSATNTIDAAVALASPGDLLNTTPAADGYGTPSATIFGDGDGDGLFDDTSALLGLEVQKYGRTTGLTMGTINGINGVLSICYEAFLGILCLKSATYVDQLVIGPSGFSAGGDSGSLIVTQDGNLPVGLLFAGSSTETIANRIDLALAYFGVAIDGGDPPPPPPPPDPITDLAVENVDAPASVVLDVATSVDVTIRNAGNQPVDAGALVTLRDATAAVVIGTQAAPALAAGESATLPFGWTPTGATGARTLTATHDLSDDVSENDEGSTAVLVNATATGFHVGDLDGISSNDGKTWSATVEVTIHDAAHNPVNGRTVTGAWTPSGLASDECTTGEFGGNGTCIFLFPGLRKRVQSVSFTVLTVSGGDYDAGANHDVDGSSNGTTIVVIKP